MAKNVFESLAKKWNDQRKKADPDSNLAYYDGLDDAAKELRALVSKQKTQSGYQKIVDEVRKDLLQNAKATLRDNRLIQEERTEYTQYVALIKAAKTLGALSNIAQVMAYDYESFISLLLDSLGGREPADSAMFDGSGWDT
jgi:hypothetical protein